MSTRIITDSNGRKHITNEPLLHQPAPVQEPVATLFGSLPVYDTPPAAQRQCNWPTCQSEEYQQSLAEQIKQELVTGAAQPAVPDALFRHAPEHPQYVEGWNDCRAEMLSMRKRVKP
jgi:hypothetical protein